MENRINYDRQMQEMILRMQGTAKPRLLLHACCAPCSSACLERLLPDFAITVFYYNPNIDEEKEYRKRAAEEKRLIGEMNRWIADEASFDVIRILEGDYRPEDFHAAVRGLEAEPEGGARCSVCFHLRLAETAKLAAAEGYDCFTTTLTISPLKDAGRLNRIGMEEAAAHGTVWLPSDFKKRNGYKRSIELSEKYGLYRQNSCGCGYSKRNVKETQACSQE